MNDSIHTFIHFSRTLTKTILPCIGIGGLLGCVAVVLLITKDALLRNLPSNRYLIAVSVNSGVFLALVLFNWVETTFSLPMQNSSVLLCKLLSYVSKYVKLVCNYTLFNMYFITLYIPHSFL